MNRQQIISNLRRKAESLVREYEYEIQRTASQIELDSKQKCPVDLGKLRQSIYSKVDKDNLTAEVGATEFYAPYIEFGTGHFVKVNEEFKELAMSFYVNGEGKTRPQPFLIPAFYQNRQKFIQNIKNITKKYSK